MTMYMIVWSSYIINLITTILNTIQHAHMETDRETKLRNILKPRPSHVSEPQQNYYFKSRQSPFP